MAAVMVLELDRTYYRDVTPAAPVWFAWLALALALGAFGALLAVAFGPAVGLAPAALAFGMTLGVMIGEVRAQCERYL